MNRPLLLSLAIGACAVALPARAQLTRPAAEQALARGKQGGLGKAVSHGLWAFLRSYLLRAGFLDGREGFMLAISSAEGVYYRYLKLLYLNKR